jgi:hypothetical protein
VSPELRYYDPLVGRFITPDPMGMIDGPNLYLYCNNDPVNFIDPWGLCKDKAEPWWSWDKIEEFLDEAEGASYFLMANPMADGTPLPFDQGTGLIGLGISKGGKAVLGHSPEYILKAKKIGASYFNVAKWSWSKNLKFLDSVAARSDQILLSVKKSMVRIPSILNDEIQYLIKEKGYKWINQWSLKIK